MKKAILLTALLAGAAQVGAYADITADDVNADNVVQCIEHRINNGENREDVLNSIIEQLKTFCEDGSITSETYNECLDVINEYAS